MSERGGSEIESRYGTNIEARKREILIIYEKRKGSAQWPLER